MKLLYVAALAVCTQIAGCAAMGLPTAETFNQRAAVAYGSVTAVRNSAADLLVAQKITPAEARVVQVQSDGIRAGIDSAVAVYAADQPQAENKLQTAERLLLGLQNFLKIRSVK